MKCPSCGYLESKVIDSRPTDEGRSIRRRRECLECGARFTTFETLESYPILVIKKNGTREAFDRTKIMNGLIKACQKRPVTMEHLEKVVSDIENELQNSLNHEIQSQKIGEMIMDKLKKIDEVAYVRFASVYREFKDLDTFMRELAALKNEKR